MDLLIFESLEVTFLGVDTNKEEFVEVLDEDK
jgi:hypothetical protein